LQDLGIDGFVFHNVDSRQQLETSITPLRYPPEGSRGIAVGGPGSDYRPGAIDSALLRATDDRQFVVAQIESRTALENLESIMSGGGIDAIDVGLQDLSISLGVPGQTRHPLVEGALDRVIEVCRSRGVAIHLAVRSAEDAQHFLARGVKLLTWRTDKAILSDSYRSFVSAFAAPPRPHAEEQGT
jgi:2-keto-3-deoxy-L-rhamnonate aldolase RhmA